jgi:hypothetical protein
VLSRSKSESPPDCPTVNAEDADAIFRSSDQVLFRVHRKNLETHSNVFPSGETFTLESDEYIDMEEKSEILELFFQYVYPQRQSELKDVPFDILSGLAEVAEK